MAPLGVSVSLVNPGLVNTNIFAANIAHAKAVEAAGDGGVYSHYVTGVHERFSGMHAFADSTAVTDGAVIAALCSPTPRARYFVAKYYGYPAWLAAALVAALPTPVYDRITASL